jgi:NAD(P)-dependent dehydrogenase (short-subunit alcohol dehydrogenase family)
VQRSIDMALTEFGGLDLLCNSAGTLGSVKSVLEASVQEFGEMIRSNLLTCFLMTSMAARVMSANGVAGSIVNFSSGAGVTGFGGLALYSMAKHAVLGLTKSAAIDLAPQRIRVNAVCPVNVGTEMTAEFVGDAGRGAAHEGLLARPGTPQEIAALVCWLLSEDASYVTGAAYIADGGFLAGF